MRTKKVSKVDASKPTVEISPAEQVRSATNNPALSTDEFMLGDRKFKVLDLSYDAYLRFLTLLQPVVEVIFKGAMQKRVGIPGIPLVDINKEQLSLAKLIDVCGTSLPEMACIVCNQSDQTITPDEVKRLGKNPFKLASIIFMQIQRNNVIQDFLDFFGQVAPMMTQLFSKS